MQVRLTRKAEPCCGCLHNKDTAVLWTVHSAPEKPEFTYLYATNTAIIQTLSCPSSVFITEIIPFIIW